MLSGEVAFRNGDAVHVSDAPSSKRRTRSNTLAKKKVSKSRSAEKKKTKQHPFMALAGIWKDREDWRGMTSVEVVQELRKRGRATARGKSVRRG